MNLEAPRDPRDLDFTENFETKALGLNQEDYLREAKEKGETVEALIAGLQENDATQAQQVERVRQLKSTKREIGVLAGKAQKAGMLEEWGAFRDLADKIDEALKLKEI